MVRGGVALFSVFDENGEYVDDYTLEELSKMSGLSKTACYQRIQTGGQINGYRGEKADEIVGKQNPMWIEYEIIRKKILRLLRRRTKE